MTGLAGQDYQFNTILAAGEALTWTLGGAKGLTPDITSLLRQMHGDASREELGEITEADLTALTHHLWVGAAMRAPEQQLVRVSAAIGANSEPLGRDVLEVVGPDMAFLVGSVLAAVQSRKIAILAMFHPLLDVMRDEQGARPATATQSGAPTGRLQRESLIQVHIEPLDDASREALVAEVRLTLADVLLTNQDFSAMRERMRAAAKDIEINRHVPADEAAEAADFLRWLADDHFTFLGSRVYRYPRTATGELAAEEPEIEEGTGLGILTDPEAIVLRRGSEPALVSESARAFLREPSPLIIAKSNGRSRVHRRVHADYVGVKRYDMSGEVIGETRFVGLYTADSYNRMTRDVPVLRRKVRRVSARLGALPSEHNVKALQNILETYPRDELFQIDEADLQRIAIGVLHILDRPRPKLFVRRDRFDRYVSALFYVPRERFNATLRERVGEAIAAAYQGHVSAFYPAFSDAPLARVHYIIRLDPGHPEPDEAALEASVQALCQTWEDALNREVVRAGLTGAAALAARENARGATAAYRDAFTPDEAIADLERIRTLGEQVEARAFRRAGDSPDQLRTRLYAHHEPLALSACVPIFENMGLYVLTETGYPFDLSSDLATPLQRQIVGGAPFQAPRRVWVHNVLMRSLDGRAVPESGVGSMFEAAFSAVWSGLTENDGFNRLILALGIDWREAALMRTLCRYRTQTGLDPSEPVQITALSEQADITRLLLKLFTLRFDPHNGLSLEARLSQGQKVHEDIVARLTTVASADHDRVLRRLAGLILAVKRTNFYQRDAHSQPPREITVKIATRELNQVPLPKPYREIFVWSPQVEGVHLRFGAVARGGLRWSDRRDDFRTEVLGLVKAQQVKNAVIVPVGAKGGFYPKQLPRDGNRDAVIAEGTAAYVRFVSSLLALTDNLVDGAIKRPDNTVAFDGDDPYLVVAADKGTATFSDTANGLSQKAGFWLDDAFASGGSVGYDHKKMGITARGGWEAVKRHFRELGKDIQSQAFTVIGVGDMSGDVFGNAMLLSEHIHLLAAFDHRDIFIDPTPDPAISFAERKRLFDTPRTSWQSYNPELISAGGGVFSRMAKAIKLSPQMQALTGLTQDEATPQELMNALLKAPCDLMWFGGIGTYVKAAYEQNHLVGDRANDAIRVDAHEMRAKVIGEGANLGMTQAGRIAFARAGGRINTDAVDNSAGVDSSDHEVNIKILLSEAIKGGELKREDRNDLLAAMTDDVAAHVLRHNYDQTLALTVAESRAAQDVDAHQRFIERLEAAGKLDRKVEGLPQADGFQELKNNGRGLTRPELAVLLAYAKIDLFDEIVSSDAPDDSYFETVLAQYFPKGCRGFTGAMSRHRLRREIIATVLANDIVNLGGPTFVHRVRESAEVQTAAITKAFAAAREIFGIPAMIAQINALDGKAPASVQTDMLLELVTVLRRQCFWLARRSRDREAGLAVNSLIGDYADSVKDWRAGIGSLLSPFEAERVRQRSAHFKAQGAPDALADQVALMRPMTSATDIVDIATASGHSVGAAGAVYHALGDAFRFDELRFAAGDVALPQHWDRLATRRIIEALMGQQQDLARRMLHQVTPGCPLDATQAMEVVSTWRQQHESASGRLMHALDEVKASGPWSFAKLVLVGDALREFIAVTA
jgi:glutamate dehydrogenase